MEKLKSFAEIVKQGQEDKKLKEAQETQAIVERNVPLLSELFSAIAKSKTALPQQVQDEPHVEEFVEALPVKSKKPKPTPKPTPKPVLEAIPKSGAPTTLVESTVSVLNTLTAEERRKIEREEREYGDATEVEKKLFKLVQKLQNDISNLKNKVDMSSGVTAGSGEVRILRMDDVVKQAPQDGSILVWDSALNKFKLVLPSPVGLEGGSENQVLVKVSGSDNDFEWQDMKVTVPVYTKLVDVVSPTVTYIGEAAPGVTSCDPLWRIKRVAYAGQDVEITWANNTDLFDKVWDVRDTYTYNSVCVP